MLRPVIPCAKGVNKDQLPSDLGAEVWSDSMNVRCRNGSTRTRRGIRSAYTTPVQVPYGMFLYITATSRFLVELGTATIHADDGSTRSNITGVAPTGARDDRWTGGDYNSILIINNGVDAPRYWNGNTASNTASLTGWPANYRAFTMRPFRDYLVAGNIYDGSSWLPQKVMWSSSAEAGSIPTSWTASATNDAGDDPFNGIGAIVDMEPLGEANIIYGQTGRVAMRYIGGNDVFAFTRLPGNDGLLARGCVVDTPAGHVFLTPGDVMLHQGGMARSIAEGRVREWLKNMLDTSNAQRAFVCRNRQETEVWIVFPSTGQTSCDQILAWNWQDDTWNIFSAPSLTCAASGLISTAIAATTWAAATDAWDSAVTVWSENEAAGTREQLVVASVTPQIGIANTGAQDFGSTITSYAEKTGIPLSDDETFVRSISGIWPTVDAVTGTQLTIKTATTMHADDTPTYAGSSTYTQGTTRRANYFTTAGCYGAVRFESVGEDGFAMRKYQIEVPESGARW